jgi:hypothetical protein
MRTRGWRAAVAAALLGLAAARAQSPDVSQPPLPELQAAPFSLALQHDERQPWQRIRLLGALRLPSLEINGLRLGELSGLAWDSDEQLLYAISDEAALFHLRPVIQDGRLVDVQWSAAWPLSDFKGRPLRQPDVDAEGLALKNAANGKRGDSELVVAFEGRPRVQGFTPQGRAVREYPLPAPLDAAGDYAARNLMLEAVAMHPEYGLLTAPEKPLRTAAPGEFTLHGPGGRQWRLPWDAGADYALVALEPMEDGALLALWRRHWYFGPSWSTRLERLRLLPDGGIEARLLASLQDGAEWRLDNFEGLARHEGRRFFMVSDDNNSFFQDTLLVYFEVLPD